MRVLVGLSGGLDSAYTVKLLRDAGHTVEGAVLVMHDYTDVNSAKRAAEELMIPLNTLDCRKAFEKVICNLENEYILGRTPNPCVICNREVKFKYLYEYAKTHGFDKIATGHYVNILPAESGNAIYMAKDKKKDQSYMLWRLNSEIIDNLICPLGSLIKSEIRESARNIGLFAAESPESQEICFIPDGDYASYIEKRHGKSEKGYFINNEGKILGTHQGIIRYTVGQRKGLGISAGKRMFVTKIDPENNTVTLSDVDERKEELYIDDIIFARGEEMKKGEMRSYSVKLRYAQAPALASVTYLGEQSAKITLKASQRAITPGQSAVLYDKERLVMGGFIR
jgi:tRNA-specific 2-thiouridylase